MSADTTVCQLCLRSRRNSILLKTIPGEIREFLVASLITEVLLVLTNNGYPGQNKHAASLKIIVIDVLFSLFDYRELLYSNCTCSQLVNEFIRLGYLIIAINNLQRFTPVWLLIHTVVITIFVD
jgi:hypothetical protein